MSSNSPSPLRPSGDAFRPTFSGGHQEGLWIRDSLSGFHADGWLSDVLYRVKGGKEATVYCCLAHPQTGLDRIAAKVFRPRMFRAMRNDSLYKTERLMLDLSGDLGESARGFDSRSLRALKNRSRFGRRLDTALWVGHEYRTLARLHGAGAHVPRPLAASENAILMEFVGDETGPAPILQSVDLPPDEARALLDVLLGDVEALLSQYVIHADLSAYNVLLWQGEPRIIDLPQAVDALRHPQAYSLFARDVDRLCRYFARRGVSVDPPAIAAEIWSRCVDGGPA